MAYAYLCARHSDGSRSRLIDANVLKIGNGSDVFGQFYCDFVAEYLTLYNDYCLI